MNFKKWLLQEKYNYQDVLRFARFAKIKEEELEAFEKKELVKGVNVEKEHQKDADLDVIKGSESKLLKIALAHLREDEKYYSKLAKIEKK